MKKTILVAAVSILSLLAHAEDAVVNTFGDIFGRPSVIQLSGTRYNEKGILIPYKLSLHGVDNIQSDMSGILALTMKKLPEKEAEPFLDKNAAPASQLWTEFLLKDNLIEKQLLVLGEMYVVDASAVYELEDSEKYNTAISRLLKNRQ